MIAETLAAVRSLDAADAGRRPLDWSVFGVVIPVLAGSPGAGASVVGRRPGRRAAAGRPLRAAGRCGRSGPFRAGRGRRRGRALDRDGDAAAADPLLVAPRRAGRAAGVPAAGDLAGHGAAAAVLATGGGSAARHRGGRGPRRLAGHGEPAARGRGVAAQRRSGEPTGSGRPPDPPVAATRRAGAGPTRSVGPVGRGDGAVPAGGDRREAVATRGGRCRRTAARTVAGLGAVRTVRTASWRPAGSPASWSGPGFGRRSRRCWPSGGCCRAPGRPARPDRAGPAGGGLDVR